MLDEFPDVRHSLEAMAHERAGREPAAAPCRPTTLPVDQFLAQGLMEAQSLLVLDLERCTRCDQCVRACADAHDGVTRLVREGLRFDKYLVATSCRSVPRPALHGRLPGRLDPPPQHAGDHHRGLVHRLRPVRQQLPVRQHQPAPVPGRSRRSRASRPADRERQGRRPRPATLCHDHAEPSCVYACPHDAAHRVNPPEFFAEYHSTAQR